MLITTTLQYVWPIEEPAGEEPLTRAEILAHAYPALDQVADDNECTIVGHPLWCIQAGRDTKGWETWPGRVVIALVPVESHATPRNDDGEELLTRAQWQELATAEKADAEARRLAARAAEAARRDEADAEIARLYELGLSRTETQRVLALEHDHALRGAERRLGIKPTARRSAHAKVGASDLPDEKRLRELHGRGLTLAEVARALDHTAGTVTVVYERLGITPHRPGTPITLAPLPAEAGDRDLVLAA
jgi:hypothetical protein